jgi:glycosyltransferase involved in cell wall biosynthesis
MDVRGMNIVHLTASTFFGGPERQMLGLAGHMDRRFTSRFLSFPEGGRCEEFLNEVREAGFPAEALANDTPQLPQTLRELTDRLKAAKADLLVTHTFKPNCLGRIAARRLGIPCVVVSRGWTWENLKVRMYETMDRVNLRFVDHVVAVSEGQAEKVRKAGVPSPRLSVIRNAARLNAFAKPDAEYRTKLRSFFPSELQVDSVVLGAGRLSQEKGFAVMVEAAAEVLKLQPNAGFIIFGEGVERPTMESRIRELGLIGRVVLPGFTAQLDKYLPWADVVVLPSFTEGLPNVALEASAAGVPVVATAVGGTPEVIADEETGFLVPSGNPSMLGERITRLLGDAELRKRFGNAGRVRMETQFTFAGQAKAYESLFDRLTAKAMRRVA